VILPLSRLLLFVRAEPRKLPPPPRISFVRVIAAKAVLLAIALGAEWALDRVSPLATVIVAIGLVVAGPRLHDTFVLPPKDSLAPSW
jgi:hypothetical protein